MESKREPEVLAQLSTNGFAWNPVLTIVLATIAGMMAMFVPIVLEWHPFLSMAALLAGIFGVFGFLAGRMEYQLTSEGLERNFRPFLAKWLGSKKGERRQFFRFAEIVSYRRDKDLARSLRETEFLKIGVSRSPYRIWISDQIDAAGFRAFADAFVAQVESVNERIGKQPPPLPGRTSAAPVSIQRKKGFYETIWAKILTGLFVWASLGLIAAFFMASASPQSIVRFAIIIVPGTAYMVYRVFIRKGA